MNQDNEQNYDRRSMQNRRHSIASIERFDLLYGRSHNFSAPNGFIPGNINVRNPSHPVASAFDYSQHNNDMASLSQAQDQAQGQAQGNAVISNDGSYALPGL
jgi:hypothetical protein